MGIFKKQSIRLLRESWPGPQELAEELYAILNSDEPFEIDGPVTINNNTSQAPLTINNRGNTDNGIVINQAPITPPQFDIPDIPPLDIPPLDFGMPTITIIYTNGDIGTGTGGSPGGPTPQPPPKPQTGGGGGFPGRIMSGSGDTYTVEVYESGLDKDPVERTVRQLQIHQDETIPAGTWTLVGKVGNTYFMQVPVWM